MSANLIKARAKERTKCTKYNCQQANLRSKHAQKNVADKEKTLVVVVRRTYVLLHNCLSSLFFEVQFCACKYVLSKITFFIRSPDYSRTDRVCVAEFELLISGPAVVYTCRK